MFSCSLTQGIDLPWESRAHLAKIRAEVCVRGVPMSFGKTQLLSAELTKDQSTLFLPALVSYSPGLASCCHREHSLLWLPLLLLALTVCREEEKGDSTSVEWRKAVVGKESMFRLQDIDCW